MKIIQAIKLAQQSFVDLSGVGFENLLQCAGELKSLGLVSTACTQLEIQNRFEFSEIIKCLVDLYTPYICHLKTSELDQFYDCFSTNIQLVEHAKLAIPQGKILVCDDQQLWQHLQYTVMGDTYLPYDFVEKLHLYFENPCQINTMNMLNHPFLRQIDEDLAKQILVYEYKTRKNSEKNFWKEYKFENVLVKQLVDSKCWQDLPDALLQRLPLEYVSLLDDSINWFKLAVNLKTFTPQIRLGLYNALQYKPDQVVFCLKHSQIRPLYSQSLLKSTDLNQALIQWGADFSLNILACNKSGYFDHPLLKETIKLSKIGKLKFPKTVALANPPLISRPKVISASGFNQLMQDPYGYYGRYILKLSPLERVGVNSFAKEFGIGVHKLIEIYIKQGYQEALDFMNTLNLDKPKILWHGRLLRIISWVDRQFKELKPLKIESEKLLEISLVGGVLLRARIDASVFTENGNLVINFKTGTPPNKNEVITGYAPQLLVETFLCQNFDPHIQTQGEFWQLRGTQPLGVVTSSISMAMGLMQENLEKIVTHYLLSASPFLACPWPSKKPKYNEYVYLERLNNE
ncbi:MAG: PD-(D/E)XK nuclease family protein [Proteobacteria bacterium]|nr:PD-(D/E)XK nuclease family protein [Pseudomonadota bacterium]